MQNKICKLLSCILILALVVQLLPVSVLAEQLAAQETQSTGSAAVQPYERLETREILKEDVSRRGEYYKEYVLNGGLRMAAMYAEPVHYQSAAGWEEIDNTLKLTDTGYTNTAGAWSVAFPQKLGQKSGVTVTKDGYSLSFFMAGELRSNGNLQTASVAGVAESLSLQTMQASAAQIQPVERSELKAGLEHPEILPDKLNSRLEYADVFAQTDIVYDLNGSQVKESIVMQTYRAGLRGYRYALNVGQLVPVLTDSGEIHLYDAAQTEIVMTMPAPFLVDAGGEISRDVGVTLTGTGSTRTLTYLLPQQWLTDSTRQWPVVLDPVINADTSRSNIRDVSVYEQDCPEDHNSGILDVGYNNTYGIMRAYLKYDTLPALTSADVVVDAQLTLIKPETNVTTGTCAIEAHKVLATWESETTTWSNQANYSHTVEDYAIVEDSGVYHWSITDIVRGWYEGENTGLMLKAPQWVENTATGSYRKQFYSSDYSAATRPVLTIVFRNNNGLEDYWDYTAASAGRAGTGYINNYTGNLVWSHTDMGFGGNRMPVTISHIYNANDAATNLYGMGRGWRCNFNQSVTVWEENTDYYVWQDGDGTNHYFYKTDTANTYQDEDGLDMSSLTKEVKVEFLCLSIGLVQRKRLPRSTITHGYRDTIMIGFHQET